MPYPLTYAGCGQLSLDNGTVTYTARYAIGSVATYTCNAGYRRVGDATRDCTTSGWDDRNITCGKDMQHHTSRRNLGVWHSYEFISIIIGFFLCNLLRVDSFHTPVCMYVCMHV